MMHRYTVAPALSPRCILPNFRDTEENKVAKCKNFTSVFGVSSSVKNQSNQNAARDYEPNTRVEIC
jgi:hypothetical protein